MSPDTTAEFCADTEPLDDEKEAKESEYPPSVLDAMEADARTSEQDGSRWFA